MKNNERHLIYNKKIKIIGAIIAITIIIIALVFIILNKKSIKADQNINYLEISNIEDIKKQIKEVKADQEKTSSKYEYIKKYKLNKKGKLGETEGTYIYLRESLEDVNIFKTEYEVSNSNQVEEPMLNFTTMCKQQLALDENTIPVESYIVGEVESNDPVTVADCVYKYQLLCTDTYEVKDETNEENKKTYEINFYMDGNKLACELAYVIKQ